MHRLTLLILPAIAALVAIAAPLRAADWPIASPSPICTTSKPISSAMGGFVSSTFWTRGWAASGLLLEPFAPVRFFSGAVLCGGFLAIRVGSRPHPAIRLLRCFL